ncbi:MAG: acetyl-CoA carboxylase biotin carboxyl carrier protein [Planctomycetaceae bacterium]|nr:acetyl-CoA carboxylase biotin carboxyl carrier protein [Planctomycetaceae bacterium]
MNKDGQTEDVFNLERMRQIIELMEHHDLVEVDLQQGDEKIKLCRGGVPIAAAPIAAPAVAAPAAAPAAPAAEAAADTAGTVTVDAPMVGTFYGRANPDSPPYVKVGDRVSEDTIICIVEAMKVFNEIPAECSGVITEILVNDQDPVDFGKPMFRIKTS